jgi:asparagine synthase (glutamine-hydrolysing)
MTTTRRPVSPSWFCVLPDCDAFAAAAAQLGRRASRTVRHASGRIWLTGDPGLQEWRVVIAGSTRAALIGFCPLDDAALKDVVHQAVHWENLDNLADLPGSFHLLASTPGLLRAYTDAAGLRCLFHTAHRGGILISDRAATLASITGKRIDEEWLAARLICPETPFPVASLRSPYAGIQPVPPGHRLAAAETKVFVRRYWQPPDADQTIQEAASRVREALTTAVSGRTAGPASVSCQLSGGLDSSALAGLAAKFRGDQTTLLVTIASVTAANDDLVWARHIVDRLPAAEHRVLTPTEHPSFFTGLPDHALPTLDEPTPFAASMARVCHLAQVLASAGVSIHLNGQGGDEVLTAPVAYLREHLRSRPVDGWRRIRGHAALAGVPAPRLLAAMTAAPSYRSWLAVAAGDLPLHDRAKVAEMAGWEALPRLPPWATSDTENAVRDQIRSAVAVAEPLADTPTGHYERARLHAMARRSALYRDTLEALGIPVHFPYFDRSVLDSCLSVQPAQRTDPWEPKPLLRAALGAALPDRRTKGHYNTDILHGLAHNRSGLLEVFDGSALAERGIIDDHRVREAIRTAESNRIPLAFLTETLACEAWLRTLDTQTAIRTA